MSSRQLKTGYFILEGLNSFATAGFVSSAPVIPIIMKLLTTSYGLVTAGCACLMFLFFYAVIDVRGYWKWAFPFVVFGVNAVAIYMSQSIIPWRKTVAMFTTPLQPTLGSFEPLLEAIIVLAVEWSVLYWMYRRKIFLTA